MNRITQRIIIISSIIIFVSGLILAIKYSIPKPPEKEITYARICLSKATHNKAKIYSQKKYLRALEYYDSAMYYWRKENQRFILARNYGKIIDYANKSAELANKATNTSITVSKDLIVNLKIKIDSLRSLIKVTNEFFHRFPLTEEAGKNISKGKMLFHEGVAAFEAGNYLSSESSINMASELLHTSYYDSYNELKNYFKSQPYWMKLVDKTISQTIDNQSIAIIIDKFAKKLFVYQAGKKKYEFDAEFGKNWMKRKRMKNDKATPEGVYYIKNKIAPNKTKYFRALLLNYPNETDIEEFNRDMKNGKISPGTHIGGLIEIHGNGGKGIDWTDGCIALSDSDMLKVYNFVEVGTPVIIVGSIAEFKSIASILSEINLNGKS